MELFFQSIFGFSLPLPFPAFLSLAATLTNLAFAVFVLLKNPESRLNRIWFFLILCLVLWGSGEFIMRITADLHTAIVVSRISGIGFCLLPSFFLHFTCEFSDLRVTLRGRRMYTAIYVPAFIFSVLQASGFITTITHLPWGFSTTPTAAYVVYLAWLELFFLTGLYLCYRKFRQSRSQRERNQAAFVILGVTIPLLIGSINDALFPLLGVETLRVAVLTTTVTAGLLTYAIAKFQLMSLTPQTTAGNILQTMGDLLAVVDAQGNVEYTNPALKRFLTSRNNELKRLHMRDFVLEHSLVWEKISGLNHPSHASGNFRVHYDMDNGANLPVSLLVSSIYDREELLGYVLLARDITEELRLQHQVDETARLRADEAERFAASVQRVQEEERRRIARELHDDICQRLSGMRLRVGLLKNAIPGRRRKTHTELKAVKKEIDGMLNEVRRISSNLRPSALDDLGLVMSLRLLCREFQKSHRINVLFRADSLTAHRYSEQVEIAMYRIAQEALANIAHHSRARKATVELAEMSSNLNLTVTDDGRGFDMGANGVRRSRDRGLGLITMKERCELMGGAFEIESSPNLGTSIRVELPLRFNEKTENQDSHR